MLSINNIRTIAKYERKIVMRSWFFRIFAILSLSVIGLFGGIISFESNPFTWGVRSMPNGLIYSNMFLLNIFQSVIAVFLATDFIKRDKKLNTSEVLFVRPMTNFEYVIGKTFGLVSVFIVLNILLLILTAVYQLISPQLSFQLLPLLYYLFLVSIPTLVFIVGLSFALMTIIRNQPVTFIILLGYIALIIFYLASKFNYLFDYMVYAMPVAYSNIVGFSNFNHILIQRLSYLFLGCAFIFFTAFSLNRIPNRKVSKWLLSILSVLLLSLSAVGFYSIYNQNTRVLTARANAKRQSGEYFNYPIPNMTRAKIHVEYGDVLIAWANISLKNTSGENLDTLIFSLNPGFTVNKVEQYNNEVAYVQDGLLLKVIPQQVINKNDNVNVKIYYSGIPDFSLAYLDNDDEDVFKYDENMTIRVNREYGFYNDDYVLLTKENLWYPIPGIFYDPTRPAIFRQQFTYFEIEVVSKPGMLPVSQGRRTTIDSMTYKFDIRDPLPQVSLSIANYTQESINLDGLKINLCYIKGHDYFKEPLAELGDTLKSVVSQFLDDYERPMNMYYPYPQFSMVETPVQYNSLSHSWTSTRDQSQPQIVYFPEHGYNVNSADFDSRASWFKQRDRWGNNNQMSDKEIAASVFLDFLNNVFTETEASQFGNRSVTSLANPYCIFSNYYYYVNYITSEECPVLNYAFESYLSGEEESVRNIMQSRMQGLSDNEKANILLQGKSLKNIIATIDEKQSVNRVLSAKGSYLLTWMEKQINSSDFEEFLLNYLYNNSYRDIQYNEIVEELSTKFNVELGSILNDWYTADNVPAFGVQDIKSFETIDNNQVVYVLKTKVTNYSDVAGMVKFTFELQDGDGRRGGFGRNSQQESEERIYVIGENQTKELQIVLNAPVRSALFNSLLSQNIPSSTVTFRIDSKKDQTIKPVEYEKVVDKPVEFISDGEIVVDNVDSGFSYYDKAMDNPLRQFIESRKQKSEEDEYIGVRFGDVPSTWSLAVRSEYYGQIKHSALVVASGDGNKEATWKTQIKHEGYYDIYVYLFPEPVFRMHGPPGGGGPFNNENTGKYIYTVKSADGDENVEINVDDFEREWNFLGSFYFNSGEASVSLSDAGGANKVVADAVKWVAEK